MTLRILALLAFAPVLVACAPDEPMVDDPTAEEVAERADIVPPYAAQTQPVQSEPEQVQAEQAVAAPAQAAMVVHRSPTCGCCLAWADQMRAAGFAVEVREVDDLAPIKQRLGVPPRSISCHTAEIAGYFVEGHVPAEDIRRLLEERPDARGLAVPGMPLGSPGMEVPTGEVQAYEVQLVHEDGTTTVFATHGGDDTAR